MSVRSVLGSVAVLVLVTVLWIIGVAISYGNEKIKEAMSQPSPFFFISLTALIVMFLYGRYKLRHEVM